MSNLAELARKLKEVADRKANLEEQLKAVNIEWDLIRKFLIPEAMAAIDPELTKISISGLGTLYLRTDIYAGIQDQASAFVWLQENGYGDLIRYQVHPSTLKAFLKEQTKNGVEIPECFKCEAYTYAVINKS